MTVLTVRIFIHMMVFVVMCIICLSSARPVVYYLLMGQNVKWQDIPWGSRLLLAVDVGIFTMCASLYVALKIYQIRDESQLQNTYIEMGSQTKGDLENEVATNGEASGKGKYFIIRATFPALAFICNNLLTALLILLQCLNVINVGFWWTMTAFSGMQGVLIPTSLILWYPEVRMYSRRQIQYHKDEIIVWVHGATSWMKKYNTRVAPIS